MTKSHHLHRKKSIHMKFRRSPKLRRIFYHISALFERVAQERKERDRVY